MSDQSDREALKQDGDHADAHFELPTLKVGIRLINRLIANGTLSEADAATVYAHTLASISDPAQRAATSRILEAKGVRRRTQ